MSDEKEPVAAAEDTPAVVTTENNDKGTILNGEDKGKADANGDAPLDTSTISYDELKFPEGEEISDESLNTAKEAFGKMNDGKGISAEDAQVIVDMRNQLMGDINKTQTDHWDNQFAEWRETINNDKELGGDNLEKSTIPNVMRAAEAFGDPELISMLRTNKIYGENPALLKFLNNVGKTLTEDSLARKQGNAAAGNQEEARLNRMFPSAKK